MAPNDSTFIQPPQTLVRGRALKMVQRTIHTTKGDLTATWAHVGSLMQPDTKDPLPRDRCVTPYDFSPIYEDGTQRFLGFSTHAATGAGQYVLIALGMAWADGAGGLHDPVAIFEWHPVVAEERLDPGDNGRPWMRRDDVKVAKKRYCLAHGDTVDDSWIRPFGTFPRATLINGVKYILEMDWDANLELVGGENDVC